MTKNEAIARLETIINATPITDGYLYEIKTSDWKNYGKDRTYVKVIETTTNSKHYAVYDYGYIDNATGEYKPCKYKDLTKNFTLSGMRF